MAAGHRHLTPAVIVDRATTILICLWVLGLAVRLTVRDRFVPASTIFYATPLVVLAGMAAVIAVLHLVRRRRLRAAVFAMAMTACLAWWYSTCWFSHTPAPGKTDLRILAWNIAGGGRHWQAIVDQIRQTSPDIVAINEAGASTPGHRVFIQNALPEFRISSIYYGVVLLTRGEMVEVSEGTLGPRGKYKHSIVRINGRSLHIIQPEIKSNPLYSRAEAWRKIDELTLALPDEPIMILGDTNTPTDSVHLSGVRQRFVNTFEVAGDGHYATWPIPLPVIAIDHAWLSRHFRVQSCRLLWTWRSDHRPMLSELTLVEE